VKSLFETVQVGALTLSNRIVMAPLTRSRAGAERIPNDLMLEYYVQRASAGLIITEATAISPMGVGYADTPGIWSEAQVQGWKKITEAVHKAGGKMVLQLWHVGRISHSSFLKGALPVAPSAIAPAGHVSLVRPITAYETPRALETAEVKAIVQDYKHAAENAKRAGFDGVEIHGANGYLPNQFLESSTNLRTDEYGGTVENRARFLLEITDAVVDVWGADRVGLHLSPRGQSHDMGDANPKETYGYLAAELKKRHVAFLFIRERQDEGYLTPYLKERFGGAVIANEAIDPEKAAAAINELPVEMISFGRYYISNPDLVERLKKGLPLTPPEPSTFYAQGAKGYTDYPFASSKD
jgi:2,4-dienoyl-CoA reductase-like NADH-dependent reductase (Old Yellow Enzyme family)